MDCARINTAYGDVNQYESVIESIRGIVEIPIMLDIKGPEIRLNVRQKHIIKRGDIVRVGFNDEEIHFNHDFYGEADVGDRVYIDNGRIRTRAISKGNGLLGLLVENEGGEISNGKGVNIPNKKLPIPTLTQRDLELLEFAAEKDLEFIALSFTRDVQDIEAVRSAVRCFAGEVIAKIENLEGIRNIQRILEATDWVMVARGDLGVELEPQKVPLVQKSIIRQCKRRGSIVITATEMLESMVNHPFPTRAEVSDIANAVLDGTDALMLSGETAIGNYPVESVKMMSKIARATEGTVRSSVSDHRFVNISDVISKSIESICMSMPIDKIVTLTRSGYTARMISRLKVEPEIIAVTPSKMVRKQLELAFDVRPLCYDYQKDKDRILGVARELHSRRLVGREETVLFTAAFRTATEHSSNLIEIHKLGEIVDYVS